MAVTASVRLDDESAQALRRLEATGMTRSDAIRGSLVEAAARRRTAAALAEEAAALRADQEDQAEMSRVAEIMESLRAPW